jgi:hypothetical protein
MKDLGATKKILGMEIYKDRRQDKIFMSHKILSSFRIDTVKPIDTPSALNAHLSVAFAPKSFEDKEYMAHVPYASAVEFLMYDMVFTRPDLRHAVSIVSRFMIDPRKEH